MDIQVLGAWGEFLGGLAVVAGLLFVGIQLRTGNRDARAATLQTSLQMQMTLDSNLAQHADTWQKVVTNQTLDEVETRRGIILFNIMMSALENRFHQHRAGYLDDPSWQASSSAIRKSMEFDIYEEWLGTAAAATHTADFLELVHIMAAEVRSQ